MSNAMKPFKNARLTLSAACELAGGGGGGGAASGSSYKVHLAVKPPAAAADGEVRQGIVVTLIFDVSGSMNGDACKVGDDAPRFHTRLDLLKVVAELQARMLGPQDTLCLIKFSDNGMVLLPPTLMDSAGLTRAVSVIKAMVPEGSTNLWNALEVAHAVMSRAEYAESLRYAIMLTDGEESYAANHPQGTVGAFAALPRSYVLNVFGFGSALNSEKLAALAGAAGGRFSNVADFMTLATTSINCLAIGLASCHTGDSVQVTYDDGSVSNHNTSLIQYGQDRNIVFTVAGKKPVSAGLVRSGESVDFVSGLSVAASARLDMINALKATLQQGMGMSPRAYTALYAAYPGLPDVSEFNTELVLALTPENWTKWGQHYHWAYLQALQNDHRMNFKEAGQAHLGGAAFEKHKAAGDAVFGQLPKPPPTGNHTAAPMYGGGSYGYGGGYTAPVRTVATVAATNDPAASGGCWAPGSMVRMADGSRKAIELINPDDRVWTTTGDATVEYTLTLGTHATPVQNMCRVGSLLLTWYHPVFVGGIWVPACTVSAVEVMEMPVVYNLILSSGHILDIGSTLTVSLGHELTAEGVAHDYFGSKARILNAIKGIKGFTERRVVFEQLTAVRKDGLIVDWVEG